MFQLDLADAGNVRGRCLVTARWWQKFSSASWAPSIPGARALLSTLWQGWRFQLPMWCPLTPEQGCSCYPWAMVNIAILHQTSSHTPQGDSVGYHAAFPAVHAVTTDGAGWGRQLGYNTGMKVLTSCLASSDTTCESVRHVLTAP